MDTAHPDKILAFDSLFTTNHIQMLKILLPCLDRNVQKQLAVYIKLSELKYTLDFFRKNPYAQLPFPQPSSAQSSAQPSSSQFSSSQCPLEENCGEPGGSRLTELYQELLPFCSPAERRKLQNVIDMYHNFENMQEMMQVLQMMQEISPELFSTDPSGDMNRMMEILQGMFP